MVVPAYGYESEVFVSSTRITFGACGAHSSFTAALRILMVPELFSSGIMYVENLSSIVVMP